MRTYNEHEGTRICARFCDDQTGEPHVPTTVHWQLNCDTTHAIVQDFLPVSPEAELDENGNVIRCTADIVVPGSLNVIRDDCNDKELKRVMVVADMGLPGEYSQKRTYYVRNFEGRT